MQTLKDKKLER